jgi:tetratricopeptide (TPR) repeat protein
MAGFLKRLLRRFFQPLTSSQYFTGIHLYNEGAYEDAANAFELIREGVYHASVLYNRLSEFYYHRSLRNAAILAFYQRDDVRTIRLCQQALEINPDDLVCRNYIAHAFHHIGQYGASIQQLNRLRDLSSERDDVLFNLAKICIKADRLQDAKEIINILIERKPDYADFHHIRGIAFGKEGNIERAVACFSRAVEINPRYENAALLLGLEQIRAFDYRAAQKTFKAGIKSCPDNTVLLFYYSLLSTILRRLDHNGPDPFTAGREALAGRDDLPKEVLDDIAYLDARALEEHQRMLELDISYGEHFTFLDPIYDKPCLSALVGVFESFVTVYPAYADYYNKLGSFYRKIGENEKAEGSFMHALELNPEYTDALDNLAGIYESDGRIQQALDFCNRILYKAPGNPDQLIKRGRLCLKLGHFEQAAEAIISASRSDNRFTYHLYALGQILKENKRTELASRCWRVARELLPEAARDLKGLRKLERSLHSL